MKTWSGSTKQNKKKVYCLNNSQKSGAAEKETRHPDVHALKPDEDVSGFWLQYQTMKCNRGEKSRTAVTTGEITADEFRPREGGGGGGEVYWSSPHSEMVIVLEVRPERDPKASTFLITSIPSFTLPKTTCRPSSLNEQRRLILHLNKIDVIN